MKKVILSVLVFGALLATSCKKAKEATDVVADGAKSGVNVVTEGAKDGANVVSDVTKDGASAIVGAVKTITGLDGVTIPEFKDAKVGEHLQAYATYAKEYIAGGVDVAKNADLMQKGAALVTKGKAMLAGLDAESATKFKTVMSAIQAKMAPAK